MILTFGRGGRGLSLACGPGAEVVGFAVEGNDGQAGGLVSAEGRGA
jgi:hypothetical protein